ncbi:hypothetical protein HPHPA11_1289 [Helicobacter pylori Hp A-11]|uniref:Uncharacterized protein n=1 Tax=Helicobacter pylori Hp A-11 TaxID=992035 RepID=N4TAC4_HELPX|nr:hypothetical protein HPHPA11_1289 [Helicobacter pylori Hp A-11]
MVAKNSRNGLMESLLVPNNERKETDPLNLDKISPKRNN